MEFWMFLIKNKKLNIRLKKQQLTILIVYIKIKKEQDYRI